MCSCAELCIARSSAILYSGLSGFSWTASLEVRDRGVPVAGARCLFTLSEGTPGRAAGRRRERCRQNDPITSLCFVTPAPISHIPARPAASVVRPRPSRCSMITDVVCRSSRADSGRRPCRLRGPCDWRRPAEQSVKTASFAAVRQVEHADELHRDRRRRRWRRRTGPSGTGGTGRPASARRRWRRRRRRRLEPERIPLRSRCRPAARLGERLRDARRGSPDRPPHSATRGAAVGAASVSAACDGLLVLDAGGARAGRTHQLHHHERRRRSARAAPAAAGADAYDGGVGRAQLPCSDAR